MASYDLGSPSDMKRLQKDMEAAIMQKSKGNHFGRNHPCSMPEVQRKIQRTTRNKHFPMLWKPN